MKKISRQIKATWWMNCRMPGSVVLEVLKKVASRRYEKHWAAEVTEEGKVVTRCLSPKKSGLEIVSGVHIETSEISVADMFCRVEATLIIEGALNILLANRILQDFKDMGEEFQKGFAEYTQPFRVHDHPEFRA